MYHMFIGDLTGISSMTLLNNDIFWTTSQSLTVYWMSKTDKSLIKRMVIPSPQYSSSDDEMVVMSTEPLNTFEHICQKSKQSNCSHICVPASSSTFTCLCPPGLVFNDGKNLTCVEARDCEFR